jgi:hypothetical protein
MLKRRGYSSTTPLSNTQPLIFTSTVMVFQKFRKTYRTHHQENHANKSVQLFQFTLEIMKTNIYYIIVTSVYLFMIYAPPDYTA